MFKNFFKEELIKKSSYRLYPIRDIHLRSEGIYNEFKHGDIRFVWLFGAVAMIILVIACINFITLSTAKSANRAMEVGLIQHSCGVLITIISIQ